MSSSAKCKVAYGQCIIIISLCPYRTSECDKGQHGHDQRLEFMSYYTIMSCLQ